MKLINQGLFTIEGWGKNYVGWNNPEENWNGWACPHFTLENAMKILEECENVRFCESKQLSDGYYVIAYVDDDCEMQILECETFECGGEELHLFPVGTCQWVWEGVNCDPNPNEDKTEEVVDTKNNLIEAVVDWDDDTGEHIVNLYLNYEDEVDWWCVHNSKREEDCESVANQINLALTRLGLTKDNYKRKKEL